MRHGRFNRIAHSTPEMSMRSFALIATCALAWSVTYGQANPEGTNETRSSASSSAAARTRDAAAPARSRAAENDTTVKQPATSSSSASTSTSDGKETMTSSPSSETNADNAKAPTDTRPTDRRVTHPTETPDPPGRVRRRIAEAPIGDADQRWPDCSQLRGIEKAECQRRDTARDDLPAGVTPGQHERVGRQSSFPRSLVLRPHHL